MTLTTTHTTDGFSLVEALVATALVSTVVVGLVRLVIVATSANQVARATSIATLIAVEKMEQLHGLLWAFDGAGQWVADTTSDLTVVPERPGGSGLSPSPSGALRQNVHGFCDFLDSGGQALGSGTSPPPGTLYVRRWSIEPLLASPDHTLLLQVVVTEWRGPAHLSAGPSRLPGDVRLVSVKTRKAA